MDIPTLSQFLELMSGPAGWAILGAFISALCAKWPWFEAQESDIKQYVVVVLSALASMISYASYNHFPADVLQALSPYFVILYGTITAWTAGQGMHRLKSSVKVDGANFTIEEV